ncbi:deoxynucleoside kinase [Heyndrickxia oleronia]|uniref:Deoxynucleoside kinase n=1 Tax=Heyndrickxia oleronia TaxID=38875 RepID=A0A8E2IBR5_9BACI|nr:deoxynucleoside kinase [Heyndrickxia oleronia]MCM3241094.1 deoxynucleoside kinase [Heyndrickxia oleronia]MDH5164509.1 deoxynucleoside kinase [Heyndrickxia oleronia]MEC1377549.1 deoxynucleoside kinase [Heyndrickxia oleronia]OOP68045.1 deoxynucleoside kinase [Heyndrickxia oleronia]QQZ05018.1 deoxynucleoside kinase [Heyndrickxia oleronia]
MVNVPFITVEGPIGIGKTSLAKAISEHFNYNLLKEIVDENPFLEKFYQDIEEWSFQLEMFFLCNRYKQLEDVNSKFLSFDKPVVADYHIFKNLIFAKRTLKDEQYIKYLKIFDILTEGMPQPNLVIYINASLETVMRRIKLRGRDFEKNISSDYIKQLSSDYETFMQNFTLTHPNIPVLQFNGDELDFVKNPDDLTLILEKITTTLKEGVKIHGTSK